jgi:tetratricopeptide (TPR) repeat protein
MLPANRIALIVLFSFLPVALSVAAHAADAGDAGHYRSCLAAATSNPSAALDDAVRWGAAGGGLPAQHCAALALVGQGRYREAATRLDALARAKEVPDTRFRATLFDQAGNAWMLAGDGARAIASLSSALALTGGDADTFADLARAHAMRKEWREVDLDMNAALQLEPSRADLLVLRASARRALGRLKDAWADIEQALKLRPNDGDALVERGLLRKQIGDIGGAKRDFQAAIKASPSGATAAAARDNLNALSD